MIENRKDYKTITVHISTFIHTIKNKTMDTTEMLWATNVAKRKVDGTIKLAAKMQNDSEKDARLKTYKCKGCFYYPSIGGAALTVTNCKICGIKLMHSSTATDNLCLECAKKYKICKKCGGDIDMRTKRRKWPQLNSE
jgi:hypothetical protein